MLGFNWKSPTINYKRIYSLNRRFEYKMNSKRKKLDKRGSFQIHYLVYLVILQNIIRVKNLEKMEKRIAQVKVMKMRVKIKIQLSTVI